MYDNKEYKLYVVVKCNIWYNKLIGKTDKGRMENNDGNIIGRLCHTPKGGGAMKYIRELLEIIGLFLIQTVIILIIFIAAVITAIK